MLAVENKDKSYIPEKKKEIHETFDTKTNCEEEKKNSNKDREKEEEQQQQQIQNEENADDPVCLLPADAEHVCALP